MINHAPHYQSSNLTQIKKNTFWLVSFQLAKMVFPFLTLPILTRRLTVETYGNLTYVKTIMNFMQILVDFGFMLSATKELAKINHVNHQGKTSHLIESIISDTMLARIILGVFGFLLTLLLCQTIPILKQNLYFTLLSYLPVFLSIFLFDFLFRGLEIIHIMTIRFILMKIISLILTIIFVQRDQQIVLIPIFDILSSFIAIFLVIFEIKKLGFHFNKPNLRSSLLALKNSFIYFLSDISATTFNAISTIIIGLVFTSTDVGLFGLSIQIIGAIQSLLGQLSNSVYPQMIREKSYTFIKQIFKRTLPVIFTFTLLVTIFSPIVLQIIASSKYHQAAQIIQILAITIFISFCNTLLGWPTLGVINHQTSVTISTISSTVFNLTALLILFSCQKLTLISVAIIRVVTEVILFAIRYYFFKKYRQEFNS